MDWNSISLKKYNQIKEILLDPEFNDEDRVIYQIQILFNIDPLKLSVQELKYYIKEMGFLQKPIPKMKIKNTYKLGKNKYKLDKRLEKFTVAQFLDWRNLINEGGTDTDNYANLLSVFFIPEDKKEYNEDYDIQEVKNDISEHLSIPDAMSIASFFLTFRKTLLVRSLLYSRFLTLRTKIPLQKKREVRKEYRKAILKVITGK